MWQVNETWMLISSWQTRLPTHTVQYPSRAATISKTTPASNWLQQLQDRSRMKMEMRNECGRNHSSQLIPKSSLFLTLSYPRRKALKGVMPLLPGSPLVTAEPRVWPRAHQEMLQKERLQINTGQATSVSQLQANENSLLRGNQESRYLGITWLKIPN